MDTGVSRQQKLHQKVRQRTKSPKRKRLGVPVSPQEFQHMLRNVRQFDSDSSDSEPIKVQKPRLTRLRSSTPKKHVAKMQREPSRPRNKQEVQTGRWYTDSESSESESEDVVVDESEFQSLKPSRLFFLLLLLFRREEFKLLLLLLFVEASGGPKKLAEIA